MRVQGFETKIDKMSIAAISFSLFGFLGNVMLDYNWGTNLVTSSFAIAYTLTLRALIPFPSGYYGIGAGAYFTVFLVSFLILNRRESLPRNIFQTLSLGSGVIILFEIGLWYFVPYFMDKYVIDAIRNTPLSGFTNWDLLVLASCGAVLSQILPHLQKWIWQY